MKNTQNEIDRQEQELKELLQRVMQSPLEPLSQSVAGLDERIEQVEELVQDLRDVELAALSLGADDSRKQMRALRSLAEETPREVHSTLRPLLEKCLVELEQQRQRTLTELQQDLQKVLLQGLTQQSGALANAVGALLQASSDAIVPKVQALSERVNEVRTGQRVQQQSLEGLPAQLDQLPARWMPKLEQLAEQQEQQLQMLQQLRQAESVLSTQLVELRRWLLAAVTLGGLGLSVGVALSLRIWG